MHVFCLLSENLFAGERSSLDGKFCYSFSHFVTTFAHQCCLRCFSKSVAHSPAVCGRLRWAKTETRFHSRDACLVADERTAFWKLEPVCVRVHPCTGPTLLSVWEAPPAPCPLLSLPHSRKEGARLSHCGASPSSGKLSVFWCLLRLATAGPYGHLLFSACPPHLISAAFGSIDLFFPACNWSLPPTFTKNVGFKACGLFLVSFLLFLFYNFQE